MPLKHPKEVAKELPKSSRLEQIKAEIIERNVCPDLAQAAKHLVMGVGDPNAAILFVGEAPGKNEDELGEPFVGAAGKVLNEALSHAGIQRQDVYITNIVKYRPPNNRDPLPDEKQAFWPYLLQEIAIIQPKLVVTLGRHSMEYFLPKAKISDARGRVHDVIVTVNDTEQQVAVMPVYHPAATIYNRQLRATFTSDIKNIMNIINRLKGR
jgi:uracil-DNA glycosylase